MTSDWPVILTYCCNQVTLSREHAEESVIDGVVAREDAETVHNELITATELGHDVVDEINALVAGLETGTGGFTD